MRPTHVFSALFVLGVLDVFSAAIMPQYLPSPWGPLPVTTFLLVLLPLGLLNALTQDYAAERRGHTPRSGRTYLFLLMLLFCLAQYKVSGTYLSSAVFCASVLPVILFSEWVFDSSRRRAAAQQAALWEPPPGRHRA